MLYQNDSKVHRQTAAIRSRVDDLIKAREEFNQTALNAKGLPFKQQQQALLDAYDNFAGAMKAVQKETGISFGSFLEYASIKTQKSIDEGDLAASSDELEQRVHREAKSLLNGDQQRFEKFLPAVAVTVDSLTKLYAQANHPFGFCEQSMMGDCADPMVSDLEVPTNSCGPVAILRYLSEAGALPKDMPKGEKQKVFDEIESAAKDHDVLSMTLDITMPGRMTKILDHYAQKAGMKAERREFKTPQEAMVFIKDNAPVIVKIGTGVMTQHYTTVMSTPSLGGVAMFKTQDGYAIPRQKMAELLSQGPNENNVWVLTPLKGVGAGRPNLPQKTEGR